MSNATHQPHNDYELNNDVHRQNNTDSPDMQYGLPGPELLLGDIWKPCGKLTLYGIDGSGTG